MSRALLVLGALSGAALVTGGVIVGERLRLEAGPAAWSQSHPEVPLRLAQLAGPPRLPGEGWPLDSHGVLARDLGPGEAPSLGVRAQLPAGGQLELRLGGAEHGGGVALLLSRVGPGLAKVAVADGEAVAPVGAPAARRWLDCEGELPPPGEGGQDLALSVEGRTVRARVGEQEVRCTSPGAVGARVALRSGLRRVGIEELRVGAQTVRAPGPAWGLRLLGAALGAGLGAGLALFDRRRGRRGLALTLLPGLLTPWIARGDLAAALQTARIDAEQPLLWGLGLPLLLCGLCAAAVLQVRLVRSERAPPVQVLAVATVLASGPAVLAFGPRGLLALPLAGLLALVVERSCAMLGPGARLATSGSLVLSALVGGLVAALDPLFPVAILLAQGVGLLVGLLVWANARAGEVRAFNLVSLACILGALAFAEQALTWSATGMSLVGVSSRAAADPAAGAAEELDTAFRSFEALEHRREFQRYPIQDYPVRPPERAAPLRVAAIGSSSTAGAYQNDDIAEFWPADLDRLLGAEVQVINQGVGGWTSLHARRYVETRQDVLDADLLVVYLGHNDLLTESPRPYREVHAAWLAGGSASTALSSVLGELRLYQLLRFSLQGAVGVGIGPAVPVAHARDNYRAMAALMAERDGRVLLVGEAVMPDPSVTAAYGAMMAELAESSPSVAYLDAASALADPRRSGLFLDDCHLTRAGHAVLAGLVATRLQELGWVP